MSVDKAGGRAPSSESSVDPVRVSRATTGEQKSAGAAGGPRLAPSGARRPANSVRAFWAVYALWVLLLAVWTVFVAAECVYAHLVGHPFWPVAG